MSDLCLYYLSAPERDRWIPWDRHWRPLVRRIVRGRPRPGGIDKVFLNLRAGLDRLGVAYAVNKPFRRLRDSDKVGVLGRGRSCLDGYDRPNPIVAGIGLMTHPSEWPTLCDEYPVVRYLQHSEWANEVYRPYFGDRCTVWPVGIDTDVWRPSPASSKSVDFLIYNKIRWDVAAQEARLLHPIVQTLERSGHSYEIIRYGKYSPNQYADALTRARAMIFLAEHESQGIAYQECLSSGVPVLAWDPGECLDPNRAAWGQPYIPATSVPYFSEACGVIFRDAAEFDAALEDFLRARREGTLDPRGYVLSRLTLEHCAQHFVEIVDAAQRDG